MPEFSDQRAKGESSHDDIQCDEWDYREQTTTSDQLMSPLKDTRFRKSPDPLLLTPQQSSHGRYQVDQSRLDPLTFPCAYDSRRTGIRIVIVRRDRSEPGVRGRGDLLCRVR